MSTVPSTTDLRFSMSDEEYFSNPSKEQMLVSKQLRSEKFDGVIIGSPSKVIIDSTTEMPLIVLRAGNAVQMDQLPMDVHGHLLLMDLHQNRLYASGVIIPEDEDEDDEPKNKNPSPSSYKALLYEIDLHERFNFEWMPNEFIATVILRDRVSNRQRIVLKKSEKQFTDPAAEQFIADERAKIIPEIFPPIDPERALPSFEKRGNSPAIPNETGVIFQVERVQTLNPGDRWMVSGAFNLPSKPEDIPNMNWGEGTPTAIVPITLLLVGADYGDGMTVRLRVPSYQPVENGNAQGYFNINLLDFQQVVPRHQTYFLYAFAGEYMSEPTLAALITDGMVGK